LYDYRGTVITPDGIIMTPFNYRDSTVINYASADNFFNDQNTSETTLDKLFAPEFKESHLELYSIFKNIKVVKVQDNEAAYDSSDGTIYIGNETGDTYGALFHEITHAIFDIYGISGVGNENVYKGLATLMSDSDVLYVYNMLLIKNRVDSLPAGTRDDKVQYARETVEEALYA
jgi:hypothetical protein